MPQFPAQVFLGELPIRGAGNPSVDRRIAVHAILLRVDHQSRLTDQLFQHLGIQRVEWQVCRRGRQRANGAGCGDGRFRQG